MCGMKADFDLRLSSLLISTQAESPPGSVKGGKLLVDQLSVASSSSQDGLQSEIASPLAVRPSGAGGSASGQETGFIASFPLSHFASETDENSFFLKEICR